MLRPTLGDGSAAITSPEAAGGDFTASCAITVSSAAASAARARTKQILEGASGDAHKVMNGVLNLERRRLGERDLPGNVERQLVDEIVAHIKEEVL